MINRLAHRGPDAEAVWGQEWVALGHRRLSIVDLSPAGAQPMVSACGRYVIVYNGEIYTADQIRSDLSDLTFRGHSDTEAILEGCARWGVVATLDRLVGMFAFALWDRGTRTLTLARDRVGIKPLYWTQQGEDFLFASELKAFHAWPGFKPVIDQSALAVYFNHAYIPAPVTVYKGVQKLEPGTVLTLDASGRATTTTYWSLRHKAIWGAAHRYEGADQDISDQFHDLAADAVGKRMLADVPLGAFLSGGVDSSLVVALMQAQSSTKVRTFSIAFDVPGYDESEHARKVAAHLGTEHNELAVTGRDTLDVIPHLPDLYDEPFADSSQIPTFLVSKFARSEVTVALSGDGPDELFGGYERYPRVDRIWATVGKAPGPIRAACSGLLSKVGGRLAKAGEVLSCQDADAVFRRMVSVWQHAPLLDAPHAACMAFDTPDLMRDLPDLWDRMLYLDSATHLIDDVLTKVDRASMAVSLEVRVPLLDHRIVEAAFRMPMRMRRRDGKGKWVMRQSLYRHVPKDLIERPKMGFMVPIGRWLRHELRDWAEDLLSPQNLECDGLLDADRIRRCWREHSTGKADSASQLWTVLMFQAWRQRWGTRA